MTYNPISKDEERDKEKKQSEYMREMKAKTEYKKYENIFETIQEIKIEKRKVEEKEYQQFIKFRDKCIEIGWFPISFKKVNKLILRPKEQKFASKEILNEHYDFYQGVIENWIEDKLHGKQDFYKDLNKKRGDKIG